MLSAENGMQIRAAVFLALARWHHRVWAQYKVALYFSHRVLLAGEKEACWLCLDAEAANVAPDCLATVWLNKWRLSRWQVSEGEKGRTVLSQWEWGSFFFLFFKGLVNLWLKGGNHSPYLPTSCPITLLHWDPFCGIGHQSVRPGPGVI